MGVFMDRSNLPSADPSTVWLADLIEATEVLAASAEPCDPATMKAFSNRLAMRVSRRARRRGPIEQSDNSARELFWQLPIE
jgi:hypothetical protein